MRIAAVSVLTSHSAADYWRWVGRVAGGDLADEVSRLARLAVSAGARAVVASPHEISAVRAVVDRDVWIVTPGVRPAGFGADDHRRAATPEEAVQRGATHLVVGRPILWADDPARVYEEICATVS